MLRRESPCAMLARAKAWLRFIVLFPSSSKLLSSVLVNELSWFSPFCPIFGCASDIESRARLRRDMASSKFISSPDESSGSDALFPE